MGAISGRKVRIKIGNTAIAGAQADSLAINREHIDATDKDDGGVKKLLDEIGLISFELTCSGILKDATLIDWAADPTDVLKDNMSFSIEGIGTFAGSFGMTNFTIGGNEGAESGTFEATFSSSGTFQFTAAGA